MFGKGVNKSSGGNVCTAESHDECQPGTSASTPGTFENPTYLAVDNSDGPSAGDVYVYDTTDGLAQKFESSGEIVSSWGTAGQMAVNAERGMDVGSTGDLYVFSGSDSPSGEAKEYSQAGALLTTILDVGETFIQNGLKVDSDGNIYTSSSGYFISGTSAGIYENQPSGGIAGEPPPQVVPGETTGFAFDPFGEEIYQDTGSAINHYSSADVPPVDVLLDSFGGGHLSGSQGVAVDGNAGAGVGTVYVADPGTHDVVVFADITPEVATGPPTEIGETSVTLTGHLEPGKRGGDITKCRFEYGFTDDYGLSLPCSPNPELGPFKSNTNVTATLSDLSPAARDHYRLVAENEEGAIKRGKDETFLTTAPPAIDGLTAENLTSTSVDLIGKINPSELETSYRFEYGPSEHYGQVAPITPDENAGEENPIKSNITGDHEVEVKLIGLIPHIVYHYRLVAENKDGVTASEDHSFSFYSPQCPNESVRQQTQAEYVPDCRAYELVSPSNAAGTQLYAGGPNSGYATGPSRFAYVGVFGTIPEAGGYPIDAGGDLYIATRTDSGWISRYVGLPSYQASVDGGPPMGPPGTIGEAAEDRSMAANGGTEPARIQNAVFTDPEMDTFLEFNDGNQGAGSNFTGDLRDPTPVPSNAPYIYGAEGELRERWPTDLGAVPGGEHALDCSPVENGGYEMPFNCPGDVTASSSLAHFVFASETHLFAPQGQFSPPGSVYDNNTVGQDVEVASKLQDGEPIPSQPGDQSGDPLRIPAVSSDGSHILMAAGGTGPCGSSSCPDPPCGAVFKVANPCVIQPSQLYMRVDDATTLTIAPGHEVTYLAMTPSGSKVYFTSEEHLTEEDPDHGGTSLYMWSERGEEEHHPLTLVSKGVNKGEAGEPGNTEECDASWISKCGILTFSAQPFCTQLSGLGGNCLSESFVAAESGDIFFFSPEVLVGSSGVPNQWNLYDYRGGRVHFVAAFTSGPYCTEGFGSHCATTPITHMEVSPSGDHMALVTASQITQYNNTGHLEMYIYNAATEKIVCASCNPSGAPPTFNVQASQDGLFMTNDGRAFFSTEESLVVNDTNHAQDVYEYVEGRPQLITPGTGDTHTQSEPGEYDNLPGLDGVSANGTDVYFSTFDTLVPQDHNGSFLKFYDARVDGGFPFPAPPPPCEAADECHGEGSAPLPALQGETSAELHPGNYSPAAVSHRHKRDKRPRKKRHRADAKRGGKR